MRFIRFVIRSLASLLLGMVTTAKAEISLAPLFQAHAVLQRHQPVPVWGRAAPGENVNVEFAGQRRSTIANNDGRWEVTLSPLDTDPIGTDLIVSGKNRLVAPDVLVGEVWLCSGQSNMEWPLKNEPDSATKIASAHFPTIRQFKVALVARSVPAEDVTGEWIPCSAITAGNFTAAGYHFARVLQADLAVPIGLINSTWGGTTIEAWMPPETTSRFPEIAEHWQSLLQDLPTKKAEHEQNLAHWREESAAAKAAGQPAPRAPRVPSAMEVKREPSALFNGMIAPLQPFSCRGVIWYQGEGNTGRASDYEKFFPAMIEGWRHRWAQESWPFLFVQLPNYRVPNDKTGQSWAELREAQMRALALPATGAVIAIDLGVPDNGHPPDKTELGRRLAQLALMQVYRVGAGDSTGPIFTFVTREQSSFRIHFNHTTSGLVIRGPTLAGFEIAGDDDVFHPASAKIDGDTVVLSTENVPTPRQARYAWSNNPEFITLYNGTGLPASPFRGRAD